MYNVMFYHTGDSRPTILERFETEKEANEQVKVFVEYKERHGYKMTKCKGIVRYEYISEVVDRWGFTYYVEYDQQDENARLKTGRIQNG